MLNFARLVILWTVDNKMLFLHIDLDSLCQKFIFLTPNNPSHFYIIGKIVFGSIKESRSFEIVSYNLREEFFSKYKKDGNFLLNFLFKKIVRLILRTWSRSLLFFLNPWLGFCVTHFFEEINIIMVRLQLLYVHRVFRF